MGAHPDLQGFVFEANAIRSTQITNFTNVDTRIRALVGQQFDPFILESIKKMAVTLPPEPTMITEADGTPISRVEEIKYGKKLDRWLTRTDKIKQQIKQVYSVYLGRAMKTSRQALQSTLTSSWPTRRRI